MSRSIVPTDDKKEIASYLACSNAKAIDLPPIHPDDHSYPFTILDGASGVGKTQQAFSLLRAGYSVSYYINLSRPSGFQSSQPIYIEMNDISEIKQRRYLSMITTLMSKTKDVGKKGKRQQDWCSLEFLADLHEESFFQKLEDCLNSLALSLEDNHEGVLFSKSKKTTLYRNSKNTTDSSWNVLFVDEALPSRKTDEEMFFAHDVLRFVRNLGRVLGWRVVVAGTGATVASMIADASPSSMRPASGSRTGVDVVSWAHIIFIYSETESNFFGISSYSRPLVSQTVRKFVEMERLRWSRPSKEQSWLVLKYIANDMKTRKETLALDENKLVWLSGAWLEQSIEKPVSPFALQPSDLVSGHFFEPSISLVRDTGEPYLGHGLAETKRQPGPLTVTILKRAHPGNCKNPLDWCVLSNVSHMPRTCMRVSNSWARVSYFLSHCVQQCLAREPFLAVVLSLICHQTREQFQSSIATHWQESASQRSVGSADGELFEYTAFAAIQLACRSTDDSFQLANIENATVLDCLEKLFAYLAVGTSCPFEMADFSSDLQQNKVPPEVRAEDTPASSCMNFTIRMVKRTGSKTIEVTRPEKKYREKVFELLQETMPWMVPCSMPPDESPKTTEIIQLSELLNIAALVPGENNASLDAIAYPSNGKRPWFFEFKGRATNDYTVKEGYFDLKKKCGKRLCHALLVASTAHQRSDCTVWLENNNLRAVMRIANHYKLVHQRHEFTKFRLVLEDDDGIPGMTRL